MPSISCDSSDHDSGVQMTQLVANSGTDLLAPISKVSPHYVFGCNLVSSSEADAHLDGGITDSMWDAVHYVILFFCISFFML